MKQCIYIILAAVLLSGCVTNEVTHMAQGITHWPFYARNVSKAYFNPTSNELVIEVDPSILDRVTIAPLEDDPFTKDEQREHRCFKVDITEALTQATEYLTFSVDHATVCPENDSVLYDHIPVKKISSRSVVTITKHSAWILGHDYQLDKLWLIRGSGEIRVILLKIPKITNRKPLAYLLYPFSIVADIITAPIQLILYVYLENVMTPDI